MKLSIPLSLFFTNLLQSAAPASAQIQECSAHPDPHFKTWQNDYYDYHGGCDLVLVQNNLLKLHIRTHAVVGYSYVEAAALRIGSDTLEIDTSGGVTTPTLNGNSPLPSTISGFPLNQGTFYGNPSHEVILNNGASIRIHEYSSYGLSISVYGDYAGFHDSEGMCGNWTTSGLFDRNDQTVADGNAMGEEWRVQTILGDIEIFQNASQDSCTPPIPYGGGGGDGDGMDPDHQVDEHTDQPTEDNNMDQDDTDPPTDTSIPTTYPSTADCDQTEYCGMYNADCECIAMRRLQGGEAEEACSDVPEGPQRENCIYDVTTTGDKTTFANAPFYDPVPPPPPADDRCIGLDACQNHHQDAVCVYNCVPDSNFECIPDLCSESTSTSGGGNNCACKAPKSNPNINGDPHIQTWSGAKYDFHGVCDLVLLQNPGFGEGLGMDIHVRTEQIKQFSYVSSAVLRIGNATLEVMGDLHENLYWINKQANANLDRGIGGYPVSYRKVNSKQHEFVVDLGGGKKSIVFKTFKKFVRVSIQGATKDSFGTSLGLLGSYNSGNFIARDKTTVLKDTNIFGQEWQVLPVEDMLFHNVKGPQAPKKCDIPAAKTLRRRLVESSIGEKEAESICARAAPEDFDLCVFDVMATGDKDVVGAH